MAGSIISYIKRQFRDSIILHWLWTKIMEMLGGARSSTVAKLTGSYSGSLTCLDNRTGKTCK